MRRRIYFQIGSEKEKVLFFVDMRPVTIFNIQGSRLNNADACVMAKEYFTYTPNTCYIVLHCAILCCLQHWQSHLNCKLCWMLRVEAKSIIQAKNVFISQPGRSPLIHQSQHQIPSFVNGRVFPINCTIKCQPEFWFNFSAATNHTNRFTFRHLNIFQS